MIYLIVDEDMKYGKIGYSNNPIGRMATIQTGMPLNLTILHVIEGTIGDEAELHEKFKEYKIRGEWFILHKSIIEYMKTQPQIIAKKNIVRIPRIGDHPVYKNNPWDNHDHPRDYKKHVVKSKHGKNMLEYVKSLVKVYDTLYIPREGYNGKYGYPEDHKQHYYKGVEELLSANMLARQAGSTMWFFINPAVVNTEGKIKLRNMEPKVAQPGLK